jgi:hypothetical protein
MLLESHIVDRRLGLSMYWRNKMEVKLIFVETSKLVK